MFPLSGKAVVITGSGGGIGAACARLAASEGAAVVVNDVRAEAVEEVVRSITSAGGVAVGAPGDVSDSGQAEAVVERCAVASLTYGWAADLADSGIRVNAVSPMAGTQMAQDVVAFQGLEPGRIDAFPTAEDNAPVVMFLLSDHSERLNGQVIRIDAGEISVIGRPAIMRPSVSQDRWDTEGVARAFADTLDAHLNPLGLLQVSGDAEYSSVKSDA